MSSTDGLAGRGTGADGEAVRVAEATALDGTTTARDRLLAATRGAGSRGPRARPRGGDALCVERWDGDEVVPFSSVRRRTATHLRDSLEVAAPALIVAQVDYTAVERARAAARRDGRRLTYLPFVARATVDALREFPLVNGVVDGDAVVVRRPINLGISVDLDFDGLVVPVIRDADRLVLSALAGRIADLAERARARRLEPDDLARGTFTITNAGGYGTLVTAPILHHPQVAILSTDGVRPTPVAVDDGHGGYAVAVRPAGNLSLTFDHRAFDGAYAASFLDTVRRTLEDRDWELER